MDNSDDSIDPLFVALVKILREERTETLKRLFDLGAKLRRTDKNPLAYCVFLHSEVSRAVDAKIDFMTFEAAPIALRLVADELERIAVRIEQMTLSSPSR